ncbi:MAG: carboxypeptidase-like regulatory domain-containing protein, partial [Bacteroidota bacterium]
MRGTLLILLFLSFNWFQVLGQPTLRVTGKLLDEATGKSITGANVVMVSVRDSTDLAYGVTDIDGNFEIRNLSNAYYKMTVTFVGYKPLKKFVRVNKPEVQTGELLMQVDTEVLEEITIRGNTVTAVQKGDTLQYNATAYQSNPDANAEDLITKMPGIIVDQSGVQAQGEQVQRVLVDGQEFFANDPAVALKTIPAEIIDKIEVFDQLSDQARFSGFDDGETTKTLNIVTKPSARNGRFGRVYAGYGTDGVYNAGGNVNDFNGNRRWTVVGLSNNINQQNFADEDIAGIASTSGNNRRGRRGRGGNRGGFNAGG